MNEDDILTVEEVAHLLKVSEKTIYAWAHSGAIPCGKLGATWRFKRELVDQWVEERLSSQKKVSQEMLHIESVLKPDSVMFADSVSKGEVIGELVDLICARNHGLNREELIKGIFHREELMSTGIGLGIGVPHVRLSSMNNVVMAAALSKDGIEDYVSIDGQPVHFVFMIVAGQYQHTEHIKLLSAISKVMKNEVIREKLLASSLEEFYSILIQK